MIAVFCLLSLAGLAAAAPSREAAWDAYNARRYAEVMAMLADVADDPELLALRGRAALALGDTAAAVKALEASIATGRAPLFARTTLLALTTRGAPAGARAAPGEALRQRGREALSRGDTAAAIAAFTQLARTHPGEGEAWAVMCRIRLSQGDRTRALTNLRQAIRAGYVVDSALAEEFLRLAPQEARRAGLVPTGTRPAETAPATTVPSAPSMLEPIDPASMPDYLVQCQRRRVVPAAEFYLRYADVLLRQGRFTEAKKLGDVSACLYPRAPASLALSSRLAAISGDLNTAATLGRQAILTGGVDTGTRLALAEVFWKLGRPGEVMNVCAPLCPAGDPGISGRALAAYGTAALSLGLAGTASEALSQALRAADQQPGHAGLSPRMRSDIAFNLALALRKLGRRDEALACLQKLSGAESAQKFDTGLDARLLAGSLLFETNRLEEALDLLQQVAARSPIAALNRAIMLRRAGRPVEAMNELRALVKRYPGFALVHFQLGRCLETLGCITEADQAYEAAAKLEPDPRLAAYYRRQGSGE